MKVTLPPMIEEQGSWSIYSLQPVYAPAKDERRFYHRLAYRALMWLHDKAESLWHWCWSASRKYAPPPSKYLNDAPYNVTYVASGMYGFASGTTAKLPPSED